MQAIVVCCFCDGTHARTTFFSTKFTLQVFVREVHGNVVSGIHLVFETRLKICLWNPGRYRHKIVRLSIAQIGLVIV